MRVTKEDLSPQFLFEVRSGLRSLEEGDLIGFAFGDLIAVHILYLENIDTGSLVHVETSGCTSDSLSARAQKSTHFLMIVNFIKECCE